jgi:hypothetical protein
MEMSPSLAAAGRSAIQEIRRLLRSFKFHYHIHNNTLLMAVQSTPFYFSNIRLNIALPPTSRSS